MSYTCKRCGYECEAKYLLKRHLERKHPCKVVYQNVSPKSILEELYNYQDKQFKCKFCENTYTLSSNLYRHQKQCNERRIATENMTTEINLLKDLILNLSTTVNTLKLNACLDIDIDKSNTCLLEDHDSTIETIKKKKSKINQSTRIVCWNTYVGEEIAKVQCLCCKTNFITQHNFHCGHVIAETNGGTVNINNLRPICAICNNSMGSCNMRQYAIERFNNYEI